MSSTSYKGYLFSPSSSASGEQSTVSAFLPTPLEKKKQQHVSYSMSYWLAQQGDSVVPSSVDSLKAQSACAEYFAQQANLQAINNQRDMNYSNEQFSLIPANKERELIQYAKLRQTFKAERNLWSLLEILTRANLFHDIDAEASQKSLENSIKNLSIHVSIPYVINTAYQNDERLQKGAILLEWIEASASDDVEAIPEVSSDPWNSTITALIEQKSVKRTGLSSNLQSSVSASHPDAQISHDFQLLPLIGDDSYDQETILKVVWSLIRAGQLKRAQEVAIQHHLYWFAGSLLGGGDPYFVESSVNPNGADEPDSMIPFDANTVKILTRLGNIRKPQWMRTCWKYSQKLFENPMNLASVKSDHYNKNSGSVIATYEMSIYAALSLNLKVLSHSPLSLTWGDKIWAYLRCSHFRDILSVISAHRSKKAEYSDLFPDCDDANIVAENEIIRMLDSELGGSVVLTGDCLEILKLASPPRTETAESYLLSLQASIMAGWSGIQQCFKDIEITLQEHSEGTISIEHWPILLRAYCHLLLWFKYSYRSQVQNQPSISDLVTSSTLHLCIEQYVILLIEQELYFEALPYLSFLPRDNRISIFASMITRIPISDLIGTRWYENSSQSRSLDAHPAEGIIRAGIQYFSENEIIDIIECVVSSLRLILPDVSIQSSNQTPKKYAATPYKVLSTSTPITQMKTPKQSALKSYVGHTPYHFGGKYVASPFSVHPESSWTPYSSSPATAPSLSVHRQLSINNSIAVIDHMLSLGKIDWSVYGFNIPSLALESRQFDGLDYRALEELVGKEDMARIASLQWLFLDKRFALQALRHAHLLMLQLTEESNGTKLLQLQVILIAYILPSKQFADSIDVIAAEVNSNQGAEDNDEISAAFNAELTLSHMWRSYLSALESVSFFFLEIKEYRRALQLMVGSKEEIRSSVVRYVMKIEKLGRAAIESIMACLESAPLLADEVTNKVMVSPANGISEAWHISRVSAIRLVESLLQGAANASSLPSDTNKLQRFIISESVQDVALSLLDDISKSIKNLASVSIPGGPQFYDKSTSMDGHIYNIADHVRNDGSYETEDEASWVISSLNKIRTTLHEIYQGRRVQALITNALLSNYLKVCVEAASVSEEGGVIGAEGNSKAWYEKASKLADVIASDDPALTLDRVVNRGDLEGLLSGISKAFSKATA